jgi:hypothetical protein
MKNHAIYIVAKIERGELGLHHMTTPTMYHSNRILLGVGSTPQQYHTLRRRQVCGRNTLFTVREIANVWYTGLWRAQKSRCLRQGTIL